MTREDVAAAEKRAGEIREGRAFTFNDVYALANDVIMLTVRVRELQLFIEEEQP